MNENRRDILSAFPEELNEQMRIWDEPGYRAGQIFSALHQRGAASFAEISVLPAALRRRLDGEFCLPDMENAGLRQSDDGTVKYAFRLRDGAVIECVRMSFSYGTSLCISSQVGCRMGCRFCASTLEGRVRDLTAAEMLAEVYAVERAEGERVSRIVVMGIGEPLDNLDQFLLFLSLITHPEGRNMSARNITVSTCGLVPGILSLAGAGIPVNLALSLHAPEDGLRRTIMPAARRYSIAECLAACDKYFAATGRRVSYEYALFAGVNDRPEQARQLAALLKGRNCHVNLIRGNDVPETGLKGSGAQETARFQKELEKNGINVTIRRSMGQYIDGACGQLRRRIMGADSGRIPDEDA